VTTLQKCFFCLVPFILISNLDFANGDTLITKSGSIYQGQLVERENEIVRFQTDAGSIVKYREDKLKELQTADGVIYFQKDNAGQPARLESEEQLKNEEQPGDEEQLEDESEILGLTGKRRCYCRVCDEYCVVTRAVKFHEKEGHEVEIPEDLQNQAKMVRASAEREEQSRRERSEWWNSLSEQEKQEWLRKKEIEKRKEEQEDRKRQRQWEREKHDYERKMERKEAELERENRRRERQREIERFIERLRDRSR
jgi:hypothetical protein